MMEDELDDEPMTEQHEEPTQQEEPPQKIKVTKWKRKPDHQVCFLFIRMTTI